VLGKSLIFAILLIAFHIVEEAIRAWFERRPLSAGLADFGTLLPSYPTLPFSLSSLSHSSRSRRPLASSAAMHLGTCSSTAARNGSSWLQISSRTMASVGLRTSDGIIEPGEPGTPKSHR